MRLDLDRTIAQLRGRGGVELGEAPGPEIRDRLAQQLLKRAVLDVSTYKPVPTTLADANQVANGMQAIQNVVNAIDNLNFAAGRIFDPAKIMQAAATDGQALLWDNANTKWAPGVAKVAYATTLPGSPTDGQETVLVDSVAAPNYAWRLRYNSTLAKWEFIGGRAKPIASFPNAVINANTQFGATGYYRNTSIDFVVPYGGSWWVDILFGVDPNGAAGWVTAASFLGAVATNALAAGSMSLASAGAATIETIRFLALIQGTAAGNTISSGVSSTVPGTHKLASHAVAIWPEKIG